MIQPEAPESTYEKKAYQHASEAEKMPINRFINSYKPICVHSAEFLGCSVRDRKGNWKQRNQIKFENGNVWKGVMEC